MSLVQFQDREPGNPMCAVWTRIYAYNTFGKHQLGIQIHANTHMYSLKNFNSGAGEMAQQWMLAALPGPSSSQHQQPVTPALADPMPSSGLCGDPPLYAWHTPPSQKKKTKQTEL